MGRPSRLTPKLHRTIVGLIRNGNYEIAACRAVGVAGSTYGLWKKRGREDREKAQAKGIDVLEISDEEKSTYWNFLDDIQRALGEAEVKFQHIISEAALKSWQAAAWMLERKYPDRWGRRDRMEHTGRDGGPIEVARAAVVDMSDEELRAIVNVQRRISGYPDIDSPGGADGAGGTESD